MDPISHSPNKTLPLFKHEVDNIIIHEHFLIALFYYSECRAYLYSIVISETYFSDALLFTTNSSGKSRIWSTTRMTSLATFNQSGRFRKTVFEI